MDRKSEIHGIIRELTRTDTLDAEADLIESGVLDSFAIVNLIAELERRFNVKIPGDRVSAESFGRIDSISVLLEGLKKP